MSNGISGMMWFSELELKQAIDKELYARKLILMHEFPNLAKSKRFSEIMDKR